MRRGIPVAKIMAWAFLLIILLMCTLSNCKAQITSLPYRSLFIVHDSIAQKPPCDSAIHALSDSLKVAHFKIERVQFYNNICIKKPSQTKFLTGWIKRATK
jgi:hypothetical protein